MDQETVKVTDKEKANAMTMEEIQAHIKADPAGYWNAVRDRSIEQLDHLKADGLKRLDVLFGHYLDGLVTVSRVQTVELAIFRTLETHIRNGTLNPQIGEELMNALTVFRMNAQAKTEEIQKQSAHVDQVAKGREKP